MEALTDTLRFELKPWGIEVICIEPGTIATPIWETSMATADNQLLPRMPPEASEMYQAQFVKTRASAASAPKRGLPPVKVAEVIEHALTARRPKTRYLVGRDAVIAGRFIARLPDRLHDRILTLA